MSPRGLAWGRGQRARHALNSRGSFSTWKQRVRLLPPPHPAPPLAAPPPPPPGGGCPSPTVPRPSCTPGLCRRPPPQAQTLGADLRRPPQLVSLCGPQAWAVLVLPVPQACAWRVGDSDQLPRRLLSHHLLRGSCPLGLGQSGLPNEPLVSPVGRERWAHRARRQGVAGASAGPGFQAGPAAVGTERAPDAGHNPLL